MWAALAWRSCRSDVVDGRSIQSVTGHTYGLVNASHLLMLIFVKTGYQLTLSSLGNIFISGSHLLSSM